MPPLDPGAEAPEYRGRRRRESASPEVQSAPDVAPIQPVYRTRAELRAAERAGRGAGRGAAKSVRQRRSAARRPPPQEARRAPRRRAPVTPAGPSFGRRGLGAVAVVAALGLAGSGALFVRSLPTADTAEAASAIGPRVATAQGALATRGSAGRTPAVQSAAGLPGNRAAALRMRAVSRSQERGPISGCDGRTPERKFINGQIPAAQLCRLPFAGGHRLRADAALRLIRLNEVYRGRFGDDLCLTDSYRSLASQYSVAARKPGLAARPGTSEHGWGLAIDVCGGADRPGDVRHDWLLRNAPKFGWENPPWARPGGGRTEPWHWEFVEGQ